MNKKIVLSLCLCVSHVAFAQQIAFSFDDGLDPANNPDACHINNDILNTLEQKRTLARGYPSVSKSGTEKGLQMISEWAKQGHRIGNHGNLHPNLNKDEISLKNYLKDI